MLWIGKLSEKTLPLMALRGCFVMWCWELTGNIGLSFFNVLLCMVSLSYDILGMARSRP